MATAYLTQASKARANPKFIEAGQVQVCSVFALSAALAAGDTIAMLTMPIGATVCDVCISSDTPLDTNVASTLSFQVGDAALATRYIGTHVQGNNIPMAPYHMDQASGHQFVAAAGAQQVIMTVIGAAATGAVAGNLRLTIEYSMDP
jgi:hypothetical protein